MQDISLHILDIVENSTVAGSKNVEISLIEDSTNDVLELRIKDDGKGISDNLIEKVTDPFVTSKKGKHIGIGLSLLEQAAERAGGTLSILPQEAKGLELCATFQYSHIDRQPVGDMCATLMVLITSYPDVNFKYMHKKNSNEFFFDTKVVKSQLTGLPINHPEVIKIIKDLLKDDAVLP